MSARDALNATVRAESLRILSADMSMFSRYLGAWPPHRTRWQKIADFILRRPVPPEPEWHKTLRDEMEVKMAIGYHPGQTINIRKPPRYVMKSTAGEAK